MSDEVPPVPGEASPPAEDATRESAGATPDPDATQQPAAANPEPDPAPDVAAAAPDPAGKQADPAALPPAEDNAAAEGGSGPPGAEQAAAREPAPAAGAAAAQEPAPAAGAAAAQDQPTAATPEAPVPPVAPSPLPPKAARPPPKSRSRKKSNIADKTTPRPAGVRPGAEVAGYLLEEQIGQGGMAVVYRARDERLDRSVALKLLAPGLAADTAFRQRFIRESRAAAAVDHPNIIPVYDAGDAGGALFIAMRYVQGGDVRSLLSAHGPLSAQRVFSIISQVAAALDAAHARGLIHRDIKPANMLLDTADAATAAGRGLSGTERHEHVYLSDFGISKQSVASQQLTSTGQFVGTLDYIAPEQIDGRVVDGRADQYSLGCAAFELLSGRPPYRKEQHLAIIAAHLSEQPPSLVAVRPELPPAVDLVLAKAMAKTPDDRYATCTQFAADLGRALGLLAGEVEAARGAVQASPGPAAGVPATPWPATELAGQQSGQAPGPGSAGGHGGPPTPPPGSQGGQYIAAAGQGPAGQHYNLDAATIGSGGQQGPPAGTAPLGASGQQPMGYGQPGGPGTYGPGQYGPGQYGPGQYGPGQYGPGQYGPGQYGPGQSGPGPNGPGTAAPPRRSRPVIAAVVAAAIAVAAVAGILVDKHLNATGGGGNPTGSPTAPQSQSLSQSPTAPVSSTPAASGQAQADQISTLLSSSTTSRSKLQTAVNDVGQCIELGFAVTQIRQIRDQRQTEYQQAQGLSASALPNGATLLTDLTQALRFSLRADNDYLTWAQREDVSCQTGSTANAAGDDSQAVSYKQAFVSLWNPVASQYSLPAANAGTI